MHPLKGYIQWLLLYPSGVPFTEVIIKYFVAPSIMNMELLYNSICI